jgi:hypothetical protein
MVLLTFWVSYLVLVVGGLVTLLAAASIYGVAHSSGSRRIAFVSCIR